MGIFHKNKNGTGNAARAAAHTTPDLFQDAYARAFTLYKRSKTCAEAKMIDASAFYLRKALEVIATSFIDEYQRLGIDQPFSEFCLKRGHLSPKGAIAPTLDDKIDFLIERKNIPAESKKAYDVIRTYGNAAVHETAFEEDAKKNAKMIKLLENELLLFYQMVRKG